MHQQFMLGSLVLFNYLSRFFYLCLYRGIYELYRFLDYTQNYWHYLLQKGTSVLLMTVRYSECFAYDKHSVVLNGTSTFAPKAFAFVFFRFDSFLYGLTVSLTIFGELIFV